MEFNIRKKAAVCIVAALPLAGLAYWARDHSHSSADMAQEAHSIYRAAATRQTIEQASLRLKATTQVMKGECNPLPDCYIPLENAIGILERDQSLTSQYERMVYEVKGHIDPNVITKLRNIKTKLGSPNVYNSSDYDALADRVSSVRGELTQINNGLTSIIGNTSFSDGEISALRDNASFFASIGYGLLSAVSIFGFFGVAYLGIGNKGNKNPPK